MTRNAAEAAGPRRGDMDTSPPLRRGGDGVSGLGDVDLPRDI